MLTFAICLSWTLLYIRKAVRRQPKERLEENDRVEVLSRSSTKQ